MMELDGWAVANIFAKWLLYGAAFAAVGSALFAIIFGARAAALAPRLRTGVIAGSALAALATGLQLMLQAGLLSGSGLMGMADPEMLELLWQTPAGDAAALRWTGLGVLALSALLPRLAFISGGAIGAVAVCASFTLVGHASSIPGGLLAGLITVHLLAGAFWAGAFWPLRAAALGATPQPEAAELADRFGKLALWVVIGLIAAGAISAYLLTGGLSPLLTSAYGWALLAKVALVGGIMLLAALNKLRLTPDMLAARPGAPAALARSINAEVILFGAVLLATATLTSVMTLPE